jgi:hypothetical protein
MMDDVLKVEKINEEYRKIRNCDRILLVDADEFVFVDKAKLDEIKDPIVSVKLYNVYRHASEGDLDTDKPIQEQRRHGCFEKMYNKPIIANTGLDIVWGPGNHTINRTPRSLSNLPTKTLNYLTGQRCAVAIDCGIIGAHWANADPCFCVDRRVKGRRDRQSKYNLEHKLTVHCHNITEESVLAECIMHENEMAVF